MGLVHRRRSETDHVGAGVDETQTCCLHLGEDFGALVADQAGKVRLGIEVLHPGAVRSEAPFVERLTQPAKGGLPLGEDAKRFAKGQGKQQRRSPGADHGDVEHGAEGVDPRIACGVDHHRVEAVGFGAEAGLEDGDVEQQPVVRALKAGRAGDDGPEVVGHVWTDGRFGQLGSSHGETRLVEGKGNEYQDAAHGVLSVSAAAVSIAEIISGFGWRGAGYALRLWVNPSASMVSAVRYDSGPGFKTGTGSRS